MLFFDQSVQHPNGPTVLLLGNPVLHASNDDDNDMDMEILEEKDTVDKETGIATTAGVAVEATML